MTNAELLSKTLEAVRKYDPKPDEALIAALVKNYALVMRRPDTALVSCSDPKELATVKKNFLIKKLGLQDGPGLDAAVQKVCERMKAERRKSRAVFYYLLVKDLGRERVFA
ncbi:DUF2853 family protein [Oceanithermus sp.]|uniref:DUF2853 family protein n=1 Tax=Oceanithermus sp. TaxID=2268145 RepID=UPI002580B434|nr:DUF2853 family protein [Oceanithermus sp.]